MQILTVVAQFAYAAVTSRLVGPEGFGAYAVALAVSGLVSLLATGGLGQAVARMEDLQRTRLRALVSFSLLLGLVAAGFVWLTAPVWGSLWGDAQSTEVIRLLSVSLLISPLVAVGTNLMRRQGSFRNLALITLAANLFGMLIGTFFVVEYSSAMSLTASAILAQLLLLVGILLMTGGDMLGVARLRNAREELGFSARLIGIKFVEYLIGNITKFSVTRWIGSSYFGHWNRADTLATIPFQQFQGAIIQAIGPEFRHDINRSHRAYSVWTDLLIMVSWIVLPASAVAASVLPPMVPIIFGPGWTMTATLVIPLAISAGFQTLSIVLATAIESIGKFKWMWSTSILLLAIQIIGAVAIFVYGDIGIAMACLVLTQVSRHCMHLFLCTKHGYIELPRILKQYGLVVILMIIIGAIGWFCFYDPFGIMSFALTIAIYVMSGSIAVIVAWRFRIKLPPYQIALNYGLIGRSKLRVSNNASES